jgi:hypothetical protein
MSALAGIRVTHCFKWGRGHGPYNGLNEFCYTCTENIQRGLEENIEAGLTLEKHHVAEIMQQLHS